MKTTFFRIGRLFLATGLLFLGVAGYSQEAQLTRQEQKEARKMQQYYNFQVLDTILTSRRFVLEAYDLDNGYGNRRQVMSNINFIMLDSTKAVLQTGSDARLGYNGVGGVTAEGQISGLKITKNSKNLSYYLKFTVSTNIGFYDVSMNISSNSIARATITGLTMGKLIYDGKIETLNNSRVYKGQRTL